MIQISNCFSYKAVGRRIKDRRLECNITQEQLAEWSGISPSFVGHIERGEKKASLKTIASMAEVLDIDLNYLVFGSKKPIPKDVKISVYELMDAIYSIIEHKRR